MKLSLIAPAYNVAPYLHKFFHSILQQCGDYELIVVDDGSTDNTFEICKQYTFYQNVKIVHQKNTGVVGAWKKGLSECIGEYVFLVDPDDYLLPGAINSILQIIEKYHPDMISCGSVFEKDEKIVKEFDSNFYNYPNGLYVGEKLTEIKNKCFVQRKNKDNMFFHAKWSCVVTKSLAQKGAFYTYDLARQGEDICFHMACNFEANSIYLCNEKIYAYNIRENSITTLPKVDDSDIENIDCVMSALKSVISDYGYYDEKTYQYTATRLICHLVKKIRRIDDKKLREQALKKVSDLKCVHEFKIRKNLTSVEWKALMVMAYLKMK